VGPSEGPPPGAAPVQEGPALGRADHAARVFELPEPSVCLAFLSNHNTKDDATVEFRGQQYFVPRHSISILPDCKTVVFSTQHVREHACA
jgi:hypothetical protein